MTKKKTYRCKLCGKLFSNDEMSEEHFPAHSVGNDDIVAFDIARIMDEDIKIEFLSRYYNGENAFDIASDIFDKKLSKTIYPKGRTARTLCISCNRFLGKYDKSYLKFFNADGNPEKIKGFQNQTKYQIIKAIYAKFISIPEAKNEKFDFLEFVNDENNTTYDGKWKLYFVKRDYTCDLLGMPDLGTGKALFDQGVVYELSDEKFIFNLMNFEKHDSFPMTNIFDILNKKYILVEGVGEDGGYHGQILMSRLLS